MITTASCLSTASQIFNPDRLLASVKSTNLFDPSNERINVQSVKVHENFRLVEFGQNDYNIGLVITQQKIPFSLHVHPVCLPRSENFEFSGKVGVVLGWGFNENYQLSTKLQQLTVPTYPLIDCFFRSNRKFFSGHATTRSFCAGFKHNNGICNGDSGGGLFIKIEGKYYIYGLSSFSNCKCVKETAKCELFDEGIFVNVAAYLKWIQNNMF